MGNVTDKAPQNYNENEVHENDYLQTYRGGGSETVNVGGTKLSIGAKIIQSISPRQDSDGHWHPAGEYYVQSSRLKGRVYLSKNGGQFVKSAEFLLKNADNYQAGPTLLVGGSPGSVSYTVFGSTSTTESNEYQPLRINSLGDLGSALHVGHPGQPFGKFGGNYGDLAVNPFHNRPRNSFSDLADFGRGVEKVADAVLVPVLEWGLDEVTDGLASTLMQITGADNLLQEQLDKLVETKGLEYKSTSSPTDPEISNSITDPRLEDFYEQMMATSRKKVGKFPKNEFSANLRQVSNVPHSTASAKMMAIHKLEDLNLRFDSSQQVKMMNKTVDMLKKLVPNPPNFNWDTVTAGMEGAQTARQQINVTQYLTKRLLKDVVPFMPKHPQSIPDRQKSVPDSSKDSPGTPVNPTPPPSSTIINGNKKNVPHPTEIPGHQPT
jgi:hypothetical protein